MKPKHIFALIAAVFFLLGCSQPIGSSLLVKGSSTSGDTTTSDPDEGGQIEMRADNTDMALSIDDSDKIEITGSCNDLNRKKNRILVEVFGGESETGIPYISNAIADACQDTGFNGTGVGLGVGEKCFWVTHGTGIVEEATLPTEHTFPQCHNGRFGFAIKLGGVLKNSPANLRYTVRFKLRTLDGLLADSVWSRVNIIRSLNIPTIDKTEPNNDQYFCSLEMSPARFNANVDYSLFRSFTDVAGNSVPVPLFVGQDSSVITPGRSVFSYSNDRTSPAQIISGVSYNYTLVATDNTPYVGGFSYAPTGLSVSSTTTTCAINKPTIEMPFPPTNTLTASGDGTGATCYLSFLRTRPVNPAIASGFVGVRWAFSTTQGWTTPTSDYNAVIPGGGISQSFCNTPTCTSTELADGLVGETTYYFAAQEFDNTSTQRGKWSNEIACKPPIRNQ